MVPDYVGMLKEFHKKYGHKINDSPSLISIPYENLRRKLIAEEIDELATAMNTNNLIDIADALADVLYVVFGTAVTYGIPIDEIFVEVHRSNMTKSTEKNEYGKTIKGNSWEPPRIREILNEMPPLQ